jgi:integrase
MSCKTESEHQARIKLRKMLRTHDDELPLFRRVTVGDLYVNLMKDYELSGHSDGRHYRLTRSRWEMHLKKPFENFKAYLFNSTAQKQYREDRLAEGASNTTINREMQILRKAFRLGYEQEPPLVKRVPKFRLVKEENARKGFANRTQVEALKKAAAEDSIGMRALLEAAHILGWRRGELLDRVRVENVNLADNCIRIESSKNGEPREAPLTATLRLFLEALIVGKKPDARVFPSNNYVTKAWPKITAKAGVPGLLFHDLRRTSARSKRAAGVDTSVIMDLMGWKTDSMFRRYAIVGTEDKSAALAKQEAYEVTHEVKPN